MVVVEDARYTKDYLDADLRSISNRVQVRFVDGSETEAFEVEYPLGHRRRRTESLGPLEDKFRTNAETQFDKSRVENLFKLFDAKEALMSLRVSQLMDLFAKTQ